MTRQCGPGLSLGSGVINGLSLLLVLVVAPRVFVQVLRFYYLQKNQHLISNFDLETVDEELLRGICPCQFLFY